MGCVRSDRAGWIGVVIHGAADLDVRRIERRSVGIASLTAVTHRPIAVRWDVDGDGFDDLVVVLRTVAGGIAEGATPVTVSGRLDDGTTFTGTDGVCVTTRRCSWSTRHAT